VSTVAGIDVSPDHFIGGERIASSERFCDRSPIDEAPLAEVARGGEREADLAVRAARAAFPGWAALGAAGRAPYLHRLADLIDRDIDRIARVECLDMAMLERSLRARVIGRGARNYRSYADLAAGYTERVWSSNGTQNRVVRMPSGPAAVITPWNAPFMLSTWKTAPALAAGCTVVLKPAEWSPLSCSLLADLAAEAGLPAGVFNVLQGIGEEAGAALVSHPDVRRVSFTGSPETGRLIGRSAAANLVPFTAELGGKGPLLVFEDADVEAAAAKAAGQYDDAGQVCLAGTRLLVAEAIRDDFLDASTATLTPTCWVTRAPTTPPSRRSSTVTTSPASRPSWSGPGQTATRSSAAAASPRSGGCGTSRPWSSRARTTPRSSSARSSGRC